MGDTAGQEKYRSFTRQYFRGAASALVLFDIMSDASFSSAHTWVEEIRRELQDPKLVIVLVGTKYDLSAVRRVSKEAATVYATAHALPYLEVSAKENTNVDQLFTEVARLLDAV